MTTEAPETYAQRLQDRIRKTGSQLCVGLDPRHDLIHGDLGDFLARVVAESAPFAAAFKPNIAYFEALGSPGIAVLEKTIGEIRRTGAPIILDCKRSDIGETQKYYARAYFANWDVDAVTLNPFLGFDTLEPFLEYPGKGIYLLAVTSNPGSADLQMQKTGGRYLFEHVQDMALRAPEGSAGLVVGLTNARPEVLERVADLPLLVPGLGAQGGELSAFAAQKREAPVLINVSRGVLFAEPDKSFAIKAKFYADRIASIL